MLASGFGVLALPLQGDQGAAVEDDLAHDAGFRTALGDSPDQGLADLHALGHQVHLGPAQAGHLAGPDTAEEPPFDQIRDRSRREGGNDSERLVGSERVDWRLLMLCARDAGCRVVGHHPVEHGEL
ncbi:MAG: hypothetical protein ABIQ33_14450 [Caldimonas sp.]